MAKELYMKKSLHILSGSIAAGMLVGIGGTVYLSCENKAVGAVLFSVALLAICMFSLYLFTGKIGYLATDRSLTNVLSLITGLVGNAVGASCTGFLIKICRGGLIEKATTICTAKLEQSYLQTFLLAAFCGVLMYTAVEIYRSKGSALGIIICIPVFILSGFEHSVADMFYFSLSSLSPARPIIFILFAVLGNAVGAIVLRLLQIFSAPRD